jgi:3-dehydroquinate dehydratase-2
LNLLGIREPHIYGKESYKDLLCYLKQAAKEKKIKLKVFQSNEEGKLVTLLHRAYFKRADGIIINPGAYTHSSYAIYDAIKAISIPVVEVHLTDLSKRETFRRQSVIQSACCKSIMGNGFAGYQQAIQYLTGEKNV